VLPMIVLLPISYQAEAQYYQPIMLDPSALKFFDRNSAFIANAEMITETDGKPDIMPVKIAILGNMTRVEMDITKRQGGNTNDDVMASYLADLKTAGSAESVSIFNPDKKCTFTILPRLKAYVQAPIPEKEMEEMKQRPKAETIELGKDKIGSHACTKYTIKFDAEGPMDVWRTWESPSATVWTAQDVPACPLRIVVLGSEGSTNCTFLIKDVQASQVDKNLFEPPKRFTKCATMDALMKIIMEHWPRDKTK
jgi:hypothetical protein